MHQPSLIATLTTALAAMPAVEAGMYLKSSPVLQLDAKNFDSQVTKSNYTSIVEFYAPWCGHCQNLKPAYEKTAKNLDGLAKVVAVDCDDESNKPLCGAQGVQGFPTIKIFRPGMKPGSKPVVEDYHGPRTASGITDEVVGKINNHVTKITEGGLDGFLGANGPKAILFTEKGTTSALIRSIAIEFLDVIKVGQVRNKEKAVVEKYGIEKYPTLVLIPEGDDAKPIVYDGDLKKPAMVDFLKQAGEPNPDPPQPKKKGDKPKKPAEPEEAPEASSASSTTENPAATVIPITPVSDVEMLREKCLQPKSHTCLLAIVPDEESETGEKAVDALSKLNAKYLHGQRHMFPFFSVPDSIASKAALRDTLEIKEEVELVAINARRNWWRHYSGGFTLDSVESWIDAIRMGEGGKNKLPSELLVQVAEEGEEGEEAEKSKEEGETKATDPEPEDETQAPEAEDEEKIVHGEL